MKHVPHTPAPWIVSAACERDIVTDDANSQRGRPDRRAVDIAICSLHPADFDSEVGIWDHGPVTAANRALIIAAPNLLDALKTTASNIRSLGPAGALDQVPMPYRAWLAAVDDAIAKATGA